MVTALCWNCLWEEALQRQNLPESFLFGNLEPAPLMTFSKGEGRGTGHWLGLQQRHYLCNDISSHKAPQQCQQLERARTSQGMQRWVGSWGKGPGGVRQGLLAWGGAWVPKPQVGRARNGQVPGSHGLLDHFLLLPSLLTSKGKDKGYGLKKPAAAILGVVIV